MNSAICKKVRILKNGVNSENDVWIMKNGVNSATHLKIHTSKIFKKRQNKNSATGQNYKYIFKKSPEEIDPTKGGPHGTPHKK